tara:strand:+ start:650 stop:892 length:243 start_codon:yes stop_codon:yes gene_type:complete
MSKLKNKKNMKNIQKGAEFVEGAIDEAADAVWGLGKFWLKMMMWFMIIGIGFVLIESTAMKMSSTPSQQLDSGQMNWGKR